MSTFGYHGVDASGRAASGVVSARSDAEAKRILAEGGIFPGSVWPHARKPFSLSLKGRLPLRQQATFVRSLATLLEARLPVLDALRVIAAEKNRGAILSLCRELGKRVEAGMSLARSLEESSHDFPPMMLSLVAAGERSGNLDASLRSFADYLEKADRMRSKLRGMMAYPLTVFCLAMALVAVLLVFVFPALESIFQTAKGTLPLPSRILLAVRGWLTTDPWVHVLIVGILAAVIWSIRGVPQFRQLGSRVVLRLPGFGKTVRAMETGRFAFTLSTLLKGGAPLEESLELTARTLRSPLFAAAVRDAREGVLQGGSLVRRLREASVFPPTAMQLIGAGEQSGDLPRMLDHVAVMFREEGERQYELLVRLAEPALILAVGALIAFIALAVLLPIFQVGQLLQR
ncbi:MAG: type II secretion system F family protein [Candidatus Tectomicrobia bacterium]|nr:type II secretion system F family protein [Candidatus Tectomicrobia bacterium]